MKTIQNFVFANYEDVKPGDIVSNVNFYLKRPCIQTDIKFEVTKVTVHDSSFSPTGKRITLWYRPYGKEEILKSRWSDKKVIVHN